MLTLKHFVCLCLFVTSFRVGKSAGNALEETSDVELKKLIAQEHYVVVLFSKSFIFYPSCDQGYEVKIQPRIILNLVLNLVQVHEQGFSFFVKYVMFQNCLTIKFH